MGQFMDSDLGPLAAPVQNGSARRILMRPWLSLALLAAFLAGGAIAFPQSTSIQTNGRLYVLSSSDAPGHLSANQMNYCVQELTRQWKQDVNTLPSIVVFHVSKKVAKAAMVAENFAVRHKRSPISADSYYEVWIVEPKTEDYVLALQAIVEDYFRLRVTDRERAEVLLRLVRVQNATVDVLEGK